jgi:predicted nucleic acid-binding protein
MPSAGIPEIPVASRIFLDSNILVYGILGRSLECRTLLGRCAQGDVLGVISVEVIEEATHKLMLAEAKAEGLIREERAIHLVDKPEAIRKLKKYWHEVMTLLAFGIQVIEVRMEDLSAAHVLRERVGLMIRDSVMAAVMARNGLLTLVTADKSLDRLADLTVYRPTDL